MKNIRAIGSILAAIALTSCASLQVHRPSTPATPAVVASPDPATRAIATTTIVSTTSAPLSGAAVSLVNRDTGRDYGDFATNKDGYAVWPAVPLNTHLVLTATKADFVDGKYEFVLTDTMPDFVAPLTPVKPPTPPPPTRRSHAELLNVRANFCNLRDAQGRVMFTPFTISLPDSDRANWYDVQRAAGSTHTVLSPQISYPGSPIPSRDLYGDPQAFREYIVEALRTPAADGKGFSPILILDDGSAGIRDRIDKFWPGIRAALDDVNDDIIVVPGWELIRASEATSADYSYALKKLHDLGFKHIGVHLSPGRASFASYPLEPDDPWQGAESGSWKSNGGEFAEIFFYQSDAVRPNDDECLPTDDGCWLNRLEDVVPRLGNGMNGWRIVALTYFEGPAYFYFKGQTDSAFAVRIANAAQKMCAKYSVSCGFGNGVPSSSRSSFSFTLLPGARVAPKPKFSFALEVSR